MLPDNFVNNVCIILSIHRGTPSLSYSYYVIAH